jgi:predicted alpha/beta hydrolase
MYENAVLNTVVVGEKTKELILYLISNNLTSIDKIHVIGHSLGGHVAGIVGKQVKESLREMIPRISGLK